MIFRIVDPDTGEILDREFLVEKDAIRNFKIKAKRLNAVIRQIGEKMHYIPKYSRERQNKRQSQKFVIVLDKKKLAKILAENKIIATNLRADTLKKVKLDEFREEGK